MQGVPREGGCQLGPPGVLRPCVGTAGSSLPRLLQACRGLRLPSVRSALPAGWAFLVQDMVRPEERSYQHRACSRQRGANRPTLLLPCSGTTSSPWNSLVLTSPTPQPAQASRRPVVHCLHLPLLSPAWTWPHGQSSSVPLSSSLMQAEAGPGHTDQSSPTRLSSTRSAWRMLWSPTESTHVHSVSTMGQQCPCHVHL